MVNRVRHALSHLYFGLGSEDRLLLLDNLDDLRPHSEAFPLGSEVPVQHRERFLPLTLPRRSRSWSKL